GEFTTDVAYLAWLQTAPSPIFLACDNGTTQLQFMRAIREMGKEGVVLDGIREHEHQDDNFQRNTTLADAAIDLFICAGASQFKGSGASSFSNTVHAL